MESLYLSTEEAAAYCNLSKDAFYGRVERRKIRPLPGSGKENTKEFRPERLRRFIQNEVSAYNHENDGRPGFVPFTALNFRDTAMTRAWDAGIDLDRAALAYGCNRETMKKHYIRKNALAVADAVFERVQNQPAKPAGAEPGGAAGNAGG